MRIEDKNKYEVWFIKDENGHTTHHYAENKQRAIQAHLVHWGKAGLVREPEAISMQRFSGRVCDDRKCIEAAQIPPHAQRDLFR